MINNNFQNILIKFGLWLATGFLIVIVGISNVFADITNNDFSFIGYTYNQTWSTSSKGTNSGTTWIISDNNLPYIYIDICSTGETATSIVNINNVQGNVSYLGVTDLKIRCSFGSYNPTLVRHYFKVNTWNQVSSSFDEWNVNFTMNFKNNAGWNIQSQVKNIATGNVGFNNDDAIINNQNQNTQNIINNQNQNTQDIINNQNQNTQQQIESQKVCTDYGSNYATITGKFLSLNGELSNDGSQNVSDYINIQNANIILLDKASKWGNVMCFYDKDKVKTQCYTQNDFNLNENISIPTNSLYFRYTIILNEGKPQYRICRNGNQALDNSINNLDGTLKDDNVDDNGVADAFESFNDFLDDNSTITQLITLPITLYTAILNNINGTCSPFNLGQLYGEDLILPCINISQYLGNSLWSMIDIIISGFAVYAISKKMIKVFNNFSSLREGDVIDD